MTIMFNLLIFPNIYGFLFDFGFFGFLLMGAYYVEWDLMLVL